MKHISPVAIGLMLFLQLNYSSAQTPDLAARLVHIRDCRNLLQTGMTDAERIEYQRNYRVLLGIVDDLSTYRDAFLKEGRFINLFPTAYYHTTVLEMEKIVDGAYVYPIEKMKQMIAFYEAYKYNRVQWDSKNVDAVEEHWKLHFEYATNWLTGAHLTCGEVGNVLAFGIIAHVGFDFPRTIKYAFDTRFHKQLTPDNKDFVADFNKTDVLFNQSLDATIADYKMAGWWNTVVGDFCPQWIVNLSKEPKWLNRMKIALPNLVQGMNAIDVINMRHQAFIQAFQGTSFNGLNGKPLKIHPNTGNLSDLLSTGKQICPPKQAGSIDAQAKHIIATKLFPFSEGYAVIHNGRNEAMINASGNLHFPYGQFHYNTEGFHFGMCGVYEKYIYGLYPNYVNGRLNIGGEGFIDLSGKLKIPYKYIFAGFFSPVLGYGREPKPGDDHPLHLIDNDGHDLGVDLMTTFLPQPGDGDVSPGIKEMGHGENRRYIFIDYKGQQKVATKFLRAHNFHEGLAAVKAGVDYDHGKWGFINEQGQTVIPFSYTHEPGDFNSGRAMVVLKEGKSVAGTITATYGYIDKSGKLIAPLTQTVGNCFTGSSMDWAWADFNDGYVLSSVPGNCYSTVAVLDVNGNKIDFTRNKEAFNYQGQMVKFNMSSENSSEYFGIDDIINGKSLSRNGPGITLTWRAQMNPITFKKGLLSPEGNLIIDPVFDELGSFDPIAKLAYAKFTDATGKTIEGYVDLDGVFQIVKQ